MELVYVELQAGDALFFHSNLLHRSEAESAEPTSLVNDFVLQSGLQYSATTIRLLPPQA